MYIFVYLFSLYLTVRCFPKYDRCHPGVSSSFKYHRKHPSVSLTISINNSLSLCISQIFKRSFSNYSHRLYLLIYFCAVSYLFRRIILNSMAEMKDAHIVEILVDEEHHQKLASAIQTISAIQNHPLAEISQSPGHFLLLKLWQREEDLYGRRMSRKESRKDIIGREIFQLCCFFFVFHGLFLTILFTSGGGDHHRCNNWWVPSVLSACTSLVIVFLVQVKLCRYWKVDRQLQRDRAEGRALARCIQELRMKGASFDLSREPQNGKRLKSSSVEIKWRPLTWCSRYRVTVFLVCFTGLVLPCCRFILCA